MSGEEAVQRLITVGRDVTADIDKIMLKLGLSANVMIYDRIYKTGKNAEGQEYRPYSTKPMLVNCKSKYMTEDACTKVLGTKTEKKEKNKRSKYEKYMAAESGEFGTKWITLNKGGKKIKLFELPEGYKQFREINNRRTDIVDLTWSGRLWSNIRYPAVKSTDADHKAGIAIIGAAGDEYRKILLGLTDGNGKGMKGRGQILDLNKEEISVLEDMVNTWVSDIIKRDGL